MRPLTRWVLDRADGEANSFGRNGGTLPVAVNVSARNLYDTEILDDVADALLSHGVSADRLQVEVTESAVMADAGRAAAVLGGLTRRGIAVSIDDFGIGNSSLGLLRRLPVGELKIDQSFISGMVDDDADDTAIVRSTSDLGHNLGLTVVAEGVEDQWTLDTLSGLGCDYAQGFYIARPMAPGDLVRWLGQSPWRMAES